MCHIPIESSNRSHLRGEHALSTTISLALILCTSFVLRADQVGGAGQGSAPAAPRYAITDLGAFFPQDINTSGQIAGALTGPAVYSGGVLTHLGTLGGPGGLALAINDAGQVTGFASTADGSAHAFLYSRGIMSDLDSFGGIFSRGNAINAAGQVVGSFLHDSASCYHALLYSAGVTIDLGNLLGESDQKCSEAGAINNVGQVIGGHLVQGEFRPFLYQDGTVIDFGSFGIPVGAASAINDAGQVVGWMTTSSSPHHAFLYSSGVVTDLGTFGGRMSAAVSINEMGQVTGWAAFQADFEHAFLYSEGVMTDLGTLGGTRSGGEFINKKGEVVGYSDVLGDLERHTFLYSDGVMSDLDSLTPQNFGKVRQVYGLNDNGQIIGLYDLPGVNSFHCLDCHGFVMTPLLNVAQTKDDCKDGGWKDRVRSDGTPFKNQGDCVSYVNTGR